MEHHFNVDIAVKYGIAEAVMLNNLWHWIKHNEANGKNFYDGDYWTYNSIKAFEKLFPYMSTRNIRTVLKHLIEADLIKTGNYNRSEYDRTLWYAFTANGKAVMEDSICQNEQIDLAVVTNGFAQTDKPIPNNKPITKNTDSKTHILSEFENLWAIYPKKQGKKQAMAAYERARNSGTTYEEVEKGIQAYKEFLKANNKGLEYVKMGSSFFNQEAWGDDWSIRYETEGDKTYGKRMGQVHNGAAPKDSRGVAGTVGRGNSGNEERIVRFPEVAYSFSEEA